MESVGSVLKMSSLGYQTMLQNGFLDLILTRDMSKLKKPLDPDMIGTAFTATEYAPTERELIEDSPLVFYLTFFRDSRGANTTCS